MTVARIRVESRDLPANATYQEREYEFKRMFNYFCKVYVEAGIAHTYKEHERYESPGIKRRRKKREANVRILKNKLRENFPERFKNHE